MFRFLPVHGEGDEEVTTTLNEDGIGKVVALHVELGKTVRPHPSGDVRNLDLAATNLMGFPELLERNRGHVRDEPQTSDFSTVALE